MDIRPYAIAISDAELADLQSRLERTRWPAALTDGWERGTPVPYAQRLAEYWRTRYDWRAEEARLNRLPQFLAEVDGQPIHGLHVRSDGRRGGAAAARPRLSVVVRRVRRASRRSSPSARA